MKILISTLLFVLIAWMNCGHVLGQQDSGLSPTSYFSKVIPNTLAEKKRTLSSQRAKRVDEITQLTTSYMEMEELLEIEQRIGTSSLVNARKTKLFNIASLIGTITSEIQMIDKWCEKRLGMNCEFPTCFGKSTLQQSENICSGHGNCVDVDTCACYTGFEGNECAQYSCFGIGFDNRTACSGNGLCSSYNYCQCKNGYFGDQCQYNSFLGEIVMRSDFVRTTNISVIPKTCSEYFKSFYKGETGSGLYLVKPKNKEIVVYCDMENGGWTLLNSIINVGSNGIPSEDLESYPFIYFTHVFLSSNLKLFKGLYRKIKHSAGEMCAIESTLIVKDPIIQFICQPVYKSEFKYSISSFVSPLKYWFY